LYDFADVIFQIIHLEKYDFGINASVYLSLFLTTQWMQQCVVEEMNSLEEGSYVASRFIDSSIASEL
jgi:hypothetical protein